MSTVGSTSSLEFLSDLTVSEERSAIPLHCWQDHINLSDIWIPFDLLPNRKTALNTWDSKGIFHTLEKRDSKKLIESFSVYSSETDENEIFLSDSDEDIFTSVGSSSKIVEKCTKPLSENSLAVSSGSQSGEQYNSYNEKNFSINNSNLQNNQECKNRKVKQEISNLKAMASVNNLCDIGTERTSNVVKSHTKQWDSKSDKYKDINLSLKCNALNYKKKPSVFNEDCIQMLGARCSRADSYISLKEILDNTPENDLGNFKTNKLFDKEQKLETKQKKNKKQKSKCVTLDEFLDDYSESDHQDDCCNSYFQKVLAEKNQNDTMQIRSTAEFPTLESKDFKFVHSKKIEKIEETESKQSIKTLAEIISQSNEATENESKEYKEQTMSDTVETEVKFGKLVIENIPKDVSEDDIKFFLEGYGKIQKFCLESTGKFFKAYAEIELDCDIDWIIECLNGTEAFGASSRPLRCYKEI